MKIDIEHLCKLSRLSIAEEKKETFTKQMENIIEMVATLPPIDSDTSVIDEKHPMELREDVIKPSSPREDILSIAPDTQAGCIVVPKVME